MMNTMKVEDYSIKPTRWVPWTQENVTPFLNWCEKNDVIIYTNPNNFPSQWVEDSFKVIDGSVRGHFRQHRFCHVYGENEDISDRTFKVTIERGSPYIGGRSIRFN
jgi:hypothetical protein